MSTEPVRIAQLVERCTWCGVGLTPQMRVVIAGGRFAALSWRLEALRGHVVSVRTAYGSEPVTAVVPLPDTPAHREGYDLLFVLCGIACRDALDQAIGDEPMTVSVTSFSSPPIPLPFRRRLQS